MGFSDRNYDQTGELRYQPIDNVGDFSG